MIEMEDHDIAATAPRGALEADGIVAAPDIAVHHPHIGAVVDIDAVVVLNDAARDRNPIDRHVIAGQVVLHPERRVAQGTSRRRMLRHSLKRSKRSRAPSS